jgi:phage terminase large subunit-like protein
LKNPALDYAESVLSGKVSACKFVRQACQRFKDDLKRKDIAFDLKAANKAITFIELQRHTKGEWKGQNLLIEPWQKFIVGSLFGFLRPDGTRKYKRAYLEMPKKQGKSPLAAAIGNYLLMDAEDGSPEIYSAATKLDQAAIVWDYAAKMFEGLASEFDVTCNVSSSFNNKRIVYNGGVFRPVAYDERDKNDGLSVSCAIIDEYHAHPSDRIYNVLADGMAARRSPLLLAITTAGHDRESACYKHREYCEKVLNKTFVDDDLFILIYTIDEGDLWDSESTWKKANPNYGVSIKPDYIKSKIAEARESGVKRDSFLIKHLNVWTDSFDIWISSHDFKKCNTEFKPLEGDLCYAGLDLASTGDFSALDFDFEKDGRHRHTTKYYLPEDKAREWPGEIGQQIRQWIRDGWITQTPGNTTDYDFIEKDLKLFCAKYQVHSVGFDPWNAKQFASKMSDDGLNMRSFSQAIGNMSHPTKRLEEFILSGNFEYDGNPVTAWMFSNVALYRDANLNIKVMKSKDANKKVDGVVAIIMATGEAIDEENKKDWFFVPQVL